MSTTRPTRFRTWVGMTVPAVGVSAVVGGTGAVWAAMRFIEARDGDRGQGIQYVLPFFSGAAAGGFIALAVAVAVLPRIADADACLAVARWVAWVPLLLATPFLLLLGGRWPYALLVVLPVVVTALPTWLVARHPSGAVRVLAVLLIGGVVTVILLGPDSVVLLVPHLTVTFGCWALVLALLLVRGRAPAATRG